jgi:hypothetical protein
MRAGSEGAADAKYDGQGHDRPFESFHTKLFLVIIMDLKNFRR